MVHCESKIAANLYFQAHYTTSRINLRSRNKPFCTECTQEYLHNACHTFFVTTTTPHYPDSTHEQQQQTKFHLSRHTEGGGEARYSFIHSSVHPSIPHLMSSPMKQGENKQLPPAQPPPRRKPYIQWGAAWFRKGSAVVLNFIFVFLSSIRNFKRQTFTTVDL